MSKFYGKVGYAETVEKVPGVWKSQIVERDYYGDTLANFRRYENNDSINGNVDINNKFSIVADPYAYQNFHNMRYVVYLGTQWKITNVEVQHPRLILTVGGLYNVTST